MIDNSWVLNLAEAKPKFEIGAEQDLQYGHYLSYDWSRIQVDFRLPNFPSPLGSATVYCYGLDQLVRRSEIRLPVEVA